MTNGLKITIQKLYEIFAKYEGLSKLEGSSLYDDYIENWRGELRSKKLRELSDEELSLFAGKVILTWGDENDYRYYLPRILELTAELKTPYDIWTIYSRLEDANWKTWDLEEQKVITDFTIELWNNLLHDTSEKAEWEFKEYFHSIANFYPNFSHVLEVWETNESYAAIKHLANYIFEEQHFLFSKNYINDIDKNTKHISQFTTWLTSDKILKKIEKAFYENENNEMAERLSWVEQILMNKKKIKIEKYEAL